MIQIQPFQSRLTAAFADVNKDGHTMLIGKLLTKSKLDKQADI